MSAVGDSARHYVLKANMVVATIIAVLMGMDPIGSGLRDGIQLVYEAGGATQPPWIYESVRIVQRDEFERCVIIARRGQAERESCARGDTLFERRSSGEYAATRPIGPAMELEVRTAAGDVMHYSTGPTARLSVDGHTIVYLPTTIVTRNAAGGVTRQLREYYAPSLLTALWGVFEEPDPTGGWRTITEFSLAGIKSPEFNSACGSSLARWV